MKGNLKKKISKIKFIFFDFDGVFTNNKVIIHQDGTEMVICSRADGIGLGLLRQIKLKMMVISTEQNPVVGKRCEKLKLPYIQACDNKLEKLTEIITEQGITLDEVAYVGNDINDYECMQRVALAISPSDDVKQILSISDIVLKKKGGNGAVREFCDIIFRILKK